MISESQVRNVLRFEIHSKKIVYIYLFFLPNVEPREFFGEKEKKKKDKRKTKDKRITTEERKPSI